MKQLDVRKLFTGAYDNLSPTDLFDVVVNQYAVDEDAYMAQLITWAEPNASNREKVEQRARKIVEQVRSEENVAHVVDKLLQEYSLENEEGVILMCLAEALMRVPDSETADALIRDKLSVAQWDKHLGKSDSLLVNASTWGLLLTGKITSLSDRENSPANLLSKLINRAGEPVIRAAMHQAMRIMGKQFVLGRNIKEAIENGKPYSKKGYTYSFDMLGEAAFTEFDAKRYFESYQNAIETLGKNITENTPNTQKSTISIKLSALHPRYEQSHEDCVLTELADRVTHLVNTARSLGVGITIDAEEMDRLELSLRLFKKVYESPAAKGWGSFGLVVQAYSKRALAVLSYLTALSKQQGDAIPVRLVKGAYWDTEIKHAQVLGLTDYPVFTRKENTDVSYLVCARFLMSQQTNGVIYPQFATHNAHTVACIAELAQDNPTLGFEFQRLHGMGDALYDTLINTEKPNVRIYAPVGPHKDLLPYLVRRLLENGANSSFVHRLVDAATPVEELIESPVQTATNRTTFRNPKIPKPQNMFGNTRQNSQGYNLNVASEREPLLQSIAQFDNTEWVMKPIIAGKTIETQAVHAVVQPFDTRNTVGKIHWTQAEHALAALEKADQAWFKWNKTPATERAACLEKFGDLLEEHTAELMALCAREAGKSLQDSIDEIREAVDFCRYYAVQARAEMAQATELPGPTGESNEHYYEGRGVFLCISPWNFPLAIFVGQVCAALVAGNTVLAKPAEQTSLIAGRAIELLHQSGVPGDVLHFLPGDGATIGQAILQDERLVGVAFTGSTQTAHLINRNLSARNGAIPTFIAETGGQNSMIVDSTALPEQVVADVMQSAFASAGQRCSALRLLCVQDDIADRIIDLISGALSLLEVGSPQLYKTDCVPVIDQEALKNLSTYVEGKRENGQVIAEATLGPNTTNGHFLAPVAIGIKRIDELGHEQFGPILHVLRYKSSELDQLIQDINRTGYGLTLGIHSRNEATAAYIESRVRVGNCYINRNQIGAVVGVQPFGGRGLSGTGPKAGGPNYIKRFATERVRTINTTAVGGNASLLSLDSSD